jgi:hypothetical protein
MDSALMTDLPKDKIILFDGVCNLCDALVQFVIQHDHKDVFRFAALQSQLGQEIIKHIGIDSKTLTASLLYELAWRITTSLVRRSKFPEASAVYFIWELFSGLSLPQSEIGCTIISRKIDTIGMAKNKNAWCRQPN